MRLTASLVLALTCFWRGVSAQTETIVSKETQGSNEILRLWESAGAKVERVALKSDGLPWIEEKFTLFPGDFLCFTFDNDIVLEKLTPPSEPFGIICGSLKESSLKSLAKPLGRTIN